MPRSGEEWAKQQHRPAEPADERRVRLPGGDARASDAKRRGAFTIDRRAEALEQADHHADVADPWHIADLARLIREQARGQQRQRGVLVAFNMHAAGKLTAA